MYSLEQAQIEAGLILSVASNIEAENFTGIYSRETYEQAEEVVLRAVVSLPYLLSTIK